MHNKISSVHCSKWPRGEKFDKVTASVTISLQTSKLYLLCNKLPSVLFIQRIQLWLAQCPQLVTWGIPEFQLLVCCLVPDQLPFDRTSQPVHTEIHQLLHQLYQEVPMLKTEMTILSMNYFWLSNTKEAMTVSLIKFLVLCYLMVSWKFMTTSNSSHQQVPLKQKKTIY